MLVIAGKDDIIVILWLRRRKLRFIVQLDHHYRVRRRGQRRLHPILGVGNNFGRPRCRYIGKLPSFLRYWGIIFGCAKHHRRVGRHPWPLGCGVHGLLLVVGVQQVHDLVGHTGGHV